MKSLQITLLLLLFGMFVHAQEITIEGQRVQIQEIQELKNPCVFSDRCPEMTPGSLMQYFYDYFNVPTLQEYRTFFSAADWFDLDQAGFENWKKYISQNPLIADAFCVFELKEKTYGIVAHYLEKGNYRARQNFLCESKNGKWHAMTSQMDADLAEVSHYLSLVDALKFKTYLNSNQGSSLSENHKRLEDSNSKGLLKEEIKKLVANPNDEAQLEKEMRDYLTKIKIEGEIADDVISLMRDLEFTKAAGLINANTNEIGLRTISQEIRSIYGDALLPTSKQN